MAAGSRSTAHSGRPSARSGSVMTPAPGPISSSRGARAARAASAMARMALFWIRKCWPNRFFGINFNESD